MTIGLLGASGYTGRLVARELDRLGMGFVAAGRDVERVGRAVSGLHHVVEVRSVDVTRPEDLLGLCDEIDLVLSTVGPFEQLGRPVLEAAIANGVHYVDSTGEQSFLRWAYDEIDPRARAAGVTAVPAAGFDYVLGDLLADRAAEAVGFPEEIHVAYKVLGGGGLLGIASAGTRRTVAAQLGRAGVARVRGEMVAERMGEARRLAWFPRPVGPAHAVGIPGGEPLMVPRHVPAVATVRTYLAMPTWQAEASQLLAAAARFGPVRRSLGSLLERGPEGPRDERRQAVRWACVAEASGEAGVARAWANGRDVYGFTATAMAVVARRILAGSAPTGVVAPAEVAPAADLLDELTVEADLRWSVIRPEPAS